jgi:hypothetical protein
MAPQSMGQPTGQPPMSPDTDAPGAVELCIEVAADGTMTVYKEVAGAQGGEMGEQESQRQPASDIGQALKLVLALYKALPQNGEQDQFAAGFNDPNA